MNKTDSFNISIPVCISYLMLAWLLYFIIYYCIIIVHGYYTIYCIVLYCIIYNVLYWLCLLYRQKQLTAAKAGPSPTL